MRSPSFTCVHPSPAGLWALECQGGRHALRRQRSRGASPSDSKPGDVERQLLSCFFPSWLYFSLAVSASTTRSGPSGSIKRRYYHGYRRIPEGARQREEDIRRVVNHGFSPIPIIPLNVLNGSGRFKDVVTSTMR